MINAINKIYEHRQDFMLVGLTGRIGAGCTTSADFLSKDITEHNLPPICVTDSSSDSDRKRNIVRKFYNVNWKPFTKIIASDIITSFLLEQSFDDVQKFLTTAKLELLDSAFQDEYTEYYDEISKIDLTDSTSKNTFDFIHKRLSKISEVVKGKFGVENQYSNYGKAYQIFGDNIRLSGSALSNKTNDFENIYAISERIDYFINSIHKQNKIDGEPTYIVIDAFRNPFEIMYFKERYYAFYIMAINAKEADIRTRMSSKLTMTWDEIEILHGKENPEDTIDSPEHFVSQNIQVCIQKSDIHIGNNTKESNYHELFGQIIKYITLIQHPGLITPSLDEKMMQVAHTAKLNSACLSRQVGASITNYNGSLKAIGWNSVAEGQTPCLLRNKDELLRGTKSLSYSVYEKGETFQASLIKFSPKNNEDTLGGRNESFCFKNIYNKQEGDKNQVHTRSLHAEENAFLQVAKYGGEGIKDGTLYSTASPCELCSKKAYQLGIKRVVFIDPYPGIAQDQILNTGQTPPDVVLFKGAIGASYHKIYDPILSYKDELKALGK